MLRAARGRPAAAAAVLATAAVAAASRWPGLFRDGLNSDEAVYSGQAAALAGFQPYLHLFGVFRAHPLLVHVLVATGYQVTGVNDWLPRVICAGFGVVLALTCLGLGWVAHGRLCGLAAGLVAALAPYPVTISRQMLLDGPAAAFTGLFMLFAAVWLRRRERRWLHAAAASAGLAFLSKETAALLAPAALLFLLAAPRLPRGRRLDVPLAAITYAAIVAAYPLSSALAGGGRTTGDFVAWQLSRPPNHTSDFYLAIAAGLGYAVLALAAAGLVAVARDRHPAGVLAVAVAGCNLAFFQAWPTKGYAYLAPVVPALAYLAGRGLTLTLGAVLQMGRQALPGSETGRRWAGAVAGLALLATALLSAGGGIVPRQALAGGSGTLPAPAPGTLAGTGGLPAARPVGAWARTSTPEGAVFLTIGPSFANVIEFYAGRRSLGLSVSDSPLRRNPSYEPVSNPDAAIRDREVQYLVYDAYSAARSPFFATRLLGYARKYDGTAVYALPPGADARTAVVVVYQVHP